MIPERSIWVELQTPASAQRMLADRVREARVGLGLKQSTLAARAGVALPTLRRFEQTGEVSLKHLTRICHALGRLDEFENILRPPPAASMAELEARAALPRRKRGSQ
ncbi:MAG TPA: helix-turn-helix transcriptional regulator [Humisphaera sp.]|jgi:transcriptional regulator with XRE-family HTH domain|nr:helix-turn-helix transcriptional regulator [Humisphaera sp.]